MADMKKAKIRDFREKNKQKVLNVNKTGCKPQISIVRLLMNQNRSGKLKTFKTYKKRANEHNCRA